MKEKIVDLTVSFVGIAICGFVIGVTIVGITYNIANILELILIHFGL